MSEAAQHPQSLAGAHLGVHTMFSNNLMSLHFRCQAGHWLLLILLVVLLSWSIRELAGLSCFFWCLFLVVLPDAKTELSPSACRVTGKRVFPYVALGHLLQLQTS